MAFNADIRARFQANPHGKFGFCLLGETPEPAPWRAVGVPAQPDDAALLRAPIVPLKGVDPWFPRHQAGLPTCVAHAAAACLEVLRATGTGASPQRLSARFLHQRIHATREDRNREEPSAQVEAGRSDAKLGEALWVLTKEGICTEKDYRETSWGPEPPTSGARKAAKGIKARVVAYEDYGPGDAPPSVHEAGGSGREVASGEHPIKRSGLARRIYAQLSKRPVCIAMPGWRSKAYRGQDLFDAPMSWLMPQTLETGILLDRPTDIETELLVDGGHVVCAIGFQPARKKKVSQRTGGGWFIFRNSWGTAFGSRVPDTGSAGDEETPPLPGPGYGAVSAKYVEDACWEWLALDLADSPRTG